MADIERVEQTILRFYGGDADADQWLVEFQSSEEAWVTSIHLLESENDEVQGFAANVLLQKARGEASGLPDTSRDELSAVLLSRAEVTPTSAVERLLYASAAAAAAPECGADPGALEAHLSAPYVAALSPTSQCGYFAALGSEFADRADRSNREEFVKLCGGAVSSLVRLADTVASGEADAELAQAVLAAVAAWGQAGLSLGQLFYSPLLEVILSWASEPDVTPAAARALTECADNPLADEDVAPLAAVLVPSLADLTPLYHAAVEGGEEEWCAAFAMMCCATARQMVAVVAECRGTPLEDTVGTVLEVVLHATEHGGLALSEETLALWDDLSAQAPRVDFWAHFLGELVKIVLGRCQYEPDFESWETAQEEVSDFRRYRRSAANVLRAVAQVHEGDVLTAIAEPLLEAGVDIPWQQWEAAFFGATAVASVVAPRSDRVFRAAASPPILGLGPDVQTALSSFMDLGFGEGAEDLHLLVQCAALRFGGAYCRWLSQDRDRFAEVIEVVVQRMGDEAVVEAAAEAFQQICSSCSRLIASSMDVNYLIQQTIHFTFPTTSASTAATALIRVIACCPVESAEEHISNLVLPIRESLQQLYTQHVEGEGDVAELTQEIAKELNVLGILIRFMDLQPGPRQLHVAVHVFEMFWETIEAIKTAFVGSDAVVREICQVFDSIIHSSKGWGLNVLPTIFQTLLSIIEQVIPEPHMMAPLTTSLEYHGQYTPRDHALAPVDEEVRAEVLTYFGQALDLAFERLGLEAPDFSRDSPAHAAYLDFATRMIIFSPESVATSESLPHILDFCVRCIDAESREALRSACPLLSRAVQSNHYDVFVRVQEWLQHNAGLLVGLLMHIVCFDGPLDVILKPVELVFHVGDAIGLEHLPEILVDAMSSDEFTKIAEARREAAVDEIMEAALTPETGKRQFVRVLLGFGKSCRL